MENSRFIKFFSSILAFVMVLSLLSPISASANTQQANPFKSSGQSESTMELKAAIAEQLNLLEGGAKLHKDLQGLSGNKQVAVIVHLSEKPVALEQGLKELAGKSFTKSQVANVKTTVKAQQALINKEMTAKNITFKKGFTFDTVLNGFAATVKAADLTKLLKINGVTLVEPDALVYASEESKASVTTKSSDVVKDDQVGATMDTSISFLGIEKLWEEGYEGQGIKVAVLDTGIDTQHPEFAGIYKGGKNFVPQVVGTDYARPRSDDDASETSPLDRPSNKPEVNAGGSSFYTSHGTHVAGTIAAIGDNEYGIKGIAPKVDLYAYRVLGAYGSGATSGIIKAIDTAVIEKMDVINLSLGGGGNSEIDGGSFAINNAMMAGTISVIATGNSGPNRGTMGTPATAPLGIAVGNTTNPETMYNSNVNITVGGYVLSKKQDLMGTTFGQDLATQLQGEFDVVAVPGNGTLADYNGLDVDGKVVLVSRGAIAFVDKIAFAKENGASAVLIHNFAGGSSAPNKSNVFLGNSFAFIPTYDLSQTDGDAIRAELANGEGKVTFGNFASTKTLGDDVNNSSSRGPSTPNFDIKPDVSAPGTNIMSSIAMYQADFPEAVYDQAYDRYTGTSMATPHIAGIAALVKQANPTWNAFDVKVALSNTAKILDKTKYDVFSQGAGRVNAYAAAHPNVLAYGLDTAVLDQSGTEVDNLKGTVTFGPQSLAENLSVTKKILVKDLKGLGGDYNVTVDVTKPFSDAKLTLDKPTFTLDGEETLNVTLTASKNEAIKAGDEILGYIHIESTDGETKISLPFAADFAGPAAAKLIDYKISETDLSFDGDGVQDEAVLSFQVTDDLKENYIEIWDFMNPDGGEYGDGYIGFLQAGSSRSAGSYTVPVRGKYTSWTPGTGLKNIPDGLYTIDFSGVPVSENPAKLEAYVGPIFVKTTDPVITSETVLVTDKASFEFAGQVTDKYIDYNTELSNYDLNYELNSKLDASFVVTGPGDNKLQSGPITLEEDGSFNLDILSTVRGNNTLTVTVDDAAGNSGSEQFVIVNEEVQAPKVVERISGADRIKTAIAISKKGWKTADTVIIAQGYNFPDALAASPLAYKLDAPILLSNHNALSTETIAELKRLKTKKVIIVGGEVAISQTIHTKLVSSGISVERVWGKNRFETAAKIAKRIGGTPTKAIVTDGFNFPDALAISSYAAQKGYPILLTKTNQLPAETKTALQSIPNTIVMGGKLAVSDAVFKQLKNPVRISGKNRYETAVAVVEKLKLPTSKVYVATGETFADALTGSVLAAKNASPIILVKQNVIPTPTAALITKYDVRHFTLLGGELAIGKDLFE